MGRSAEVPSHGAKECQHFKEMTAHIEAGYCHYGSPTRIVKASLARATEEPPRCVLRIVAWKVEGAARLARVVAGRIPMGELLPGLIVLAVGGSIARPCCSSRSCSWGSQRPLYNATALALVVLCFFVGAFFLIGGLWGM